MPYSRAWSRICLIAEFRSLADRDELDTIRRESFGEIRQGGAHGVGDRTFGRVEHRDRHAAVRRCSARFTAIETRHGQRRGRAGFGWRASRQKRRADHQSAENRPRRVSENHAFVAKVPHVLVLLSIK